MESSLSEYIEQSKKNCKELGALKDSPNHEDLKSLHNSMLNSLIQNKGNIEQYKSYLQTQLIFIELKTRDQKRFMLLIEDFLNINKQETPVKQFERLQIKTLETSVFFLKDIREFKQYIKALYVFSASTGYKLEEIFGYLKNYLKGFITKTLQNSESLNEVLEILEELKELVDINLLENSEVYSILFGLASHIYQRISDPEQHPDLNRVIDATFLLFPKVKSSPLIQFAISKIAKTDEGSGILNNPSLGEINKSRILSQHSTARSSLEIHLISSPESEPYIRKIYKFSDISLEEKIQKEIRAIQSLSQFPGFVRYVKHNKELSSKTATFEIQLSTFYELNKRDIKADHLHQLINIYFFLYAKKLRALLPDKKCLFVDNKGKVILINFGLINYQYVEGYQSCCYDAYQDFCDVPLVDFCFMKMICKLVRGYTSDLTGQERSEIMNRLNKFQ